MRDERIVMSVAEVAAALHVRRETIYEMARRGEIPCRRVGKRFLIPRAGFMEWLNAGVDVDAGAVFTKSRTRRNG